jgi:putative stress-induced transcription regulator
MCVAVVMRSRNDPGDLGCLLRVILGLAPLPASGADLAAMPTLRAALTRVAYDLAEGSPLPIPIDPPRRDDVATINAAAAVPPRVPALRPDGASTFVAPSLPRVTRIGAATPRCASSGLARMEPNRLTTLHEEWA